MMNDETTLLPCPFCGGRAVLDEYACGEMNITVEHADGCWLTEYEGVLDVLVTEKSAYIEAWNTRAAHGTLTAEQMREAIEEAKSELLESCEYVGDMGQRKGDVLKAFGKMEQALADELNAELDKGSNGECYLVHEGEKYPAELDFGFLGMMPITITVGGFRYLVEVPNGE